MLPTPSTSHVSFDRVYEPAEDSFLLLDTLSSPTETAFLSAHFPSSTPAPLLLEVGTGSGVVLAFAAAQARTLFGRPDVLALGVDINAFACAATAQTVHTALCAQQAGTGGIFLDAVNGDLTTPLRLHAVDVLIFNPPYVPTPALPDLEQHARYNAPVSPDGATTFEQDSHLLELSYAGGVDGMEITNRLLAQLPAVLSARGVAYVLLCRQNKPDNVMAEVRTWQDGSWRAEKVGDSGRQGGWEKLCVVRIWREG